jgi:hypothetical protein
MTWKIPRARRCLDEGVLEPDVRSWMSRRILPGWPASFAEPLAPRVRRAHQLICGAPPPPEPTAWRRSRGT